MPSAFKAICRCILWQNINIYIYIYTHIYIYIYICIYMYIRFHMCMSMYISYVHICMYNAEDFLFLTFSQMVTCIKRHGCNSQPLYFTFSVCSHLCSHSFIFALTVTRYNCKSVRWERLGWSGLTLESTQNCIKPRKIPLRVSLAELRLAKESLFFQTDSVVDFCISCSTAGTLTLDNSRCF